MDRREEKKDYGSKLYRQQLITVEDLQEFKHELLADIKNLIDTTRTKSKQWLRSVEVRKLLGISHGTLQNLRINGSLPYTKIGSIMFYKYEDIEKILEAGLKCKMG